MDASFPLRMIAAFAVIGLVLFGLQFVARAGLRRRIGAGAGAGRLVTVVESTYLPNAASLHVVKIGDEYAVIARSANFVGRVGEVPAATVDAWLATQSRPLLEGGMAGVVARLRARRAGR